MSYHCRWRSSPDGPRATYSTGECWRGSTAYANTPPPTARWAPTVTFLVHPNLQDPSIAHLVQVHPGPLVILTIATALQPLLLMLPERMNTLAMRHHVLLWDAAVVHTLPTQERFR